MLGRVRTARHGNGAVCRLQSGNVVHAVARHGDAVTGGLQSLDQLTLLLGGHAAEDRAALRRLGQGRIVRQRRCIYKIFPAGHAYPAGNVRHRAGIVAADDL